MLTTTWLFNHPRMMKHPFTLLVFSRACPYLENVSSIHVAIRPNRVTEVGGVPFTDNEVKWHSRFWHCHINQPFLFSCRCCFECWPFLWLSNMLTSYKKRPFCGILFYGAPVFLWHTMVNWMTIVLRRCFCCGQTVTCLLSFLSSWLRWLFSPAQTQ